MIHYEGLLDTNPDRVLTTRSLKDLDNVAVWLSAWCGSQDKDYAEKINYHVSGLDPLLVYAIATEQLQGKNNAFNPFTQSPQDGSIKKSVDYVAPYAEGEKIHAEWVNTKVALDWHLAKAGLEH